MRALVQRAVSRYVGGQLLFSLIMGTSTGVALYIFGLVGIFPDGEKFAIAFAVFYPLQARLRTTLSERRRRRWAEQEGTGPSSSDRSEDHEE